MTTTEERTPKEDLLVGGLYDLAYAAWVCNSAGLAGVVDYAQLRTLSIGLIAEVLVEGLMIPGDYDQKGHHPWPHSAGEAIEQITKEWLTEWPDEMPTPGAIVWLANTAAGDAIGRAVLEREDDQSF